MVDWTFHTGEGCYVPTSSLSLSLSLSHSLSSLSFKGEIEELFFLALTISPHPLCSPKRFVGYDGDSGDLDGDVLRRYIYGGHVSDYMKQLQDEDEEKYKAHFSRFIKEGISADNVSVQFVVM